MAKQFTNLFHAKTKLNTVDHAYENFLFYFRSVREIYGFTQKDFASLIGVTQSFESKQERGLNPFNFQQCCTIHKQFNLDYLFSIHNLQNLFFTYNSTSFPCKQFDNPLYVNLINYYFSNFPNIPYQYFDQQYRKEIELLYSILEQWYKLGEGHSKFTYFSRAYFQNSQEQELQLGICYDRCKLLEKGRILPDSKLLFYIYHNCHCRPSYFLECHPVNISVYLLLWQLLTNDTRDFLISLLSKGDLNEKYFNIYPYSTNFNHYTG